MNEALKYPLFDVEKHVTECPVVLAVERIKNGGLTNQEIEDGFFIDIVLGKCNIKKALKEINEAIRKESEEIF